jgi:hypothetical protein
VPHSRRALYIEIEKLLEEPEYPEPEELVMSREEELFKALNLAALALFKIKRMNSDAIREHAATAYKEACEVLNKEELRK